MSLLLMKHSEYAFHCQAKFNFFVLADVIVLVGVNQLKTFQMKHHSTQHTFHAYSWCFARVSQFSRFTATKTIMLTLYLFIVYK